MVPTLSTGLTLTDTWSLLDLFEHSSPMLSTHESNDLFYSNGRQYDFEDDEYFYTDYDCDVEDNQLQVNESDYFIW